MKYRCPQCGTELRTGEGVPEKEIVCPAEASHGNMEKVPEWEKVEDWELRRRKKYEGIVWYRIPQTVGYNYSEWFYAVRAEAEEDEKKDNDKTNKKNKEMYVADPPEKPPEGWEPQG